MHPLLAAAYSLWNKEKRKILPFDISRVGKHIKRLRAAENTLAAGRKDIRGCHLPATED